MIQSLLRKGVKIPNPESIEIAPEVDCRRILPGATIHAGCRIRGADTLVCAGVEIGKEAPATVENCLIGPDAELKGGYFNASVFLRKASVGSGAQVRDGTIFEEEASAAHTAGLKQTILFPFVTLGSLVNFCDCLMAGGTGKKNHSEVGSSYIHFNFTPQQDKATPSLIGDVAHGVMINQAPIFLGGQGGLVGPCRLAYGTVIAAGTINRKDELRPGRLIFGGPGKSGNAPYHGGLVYRNIKRVVLNNLNYIASLQALRHWYEHVRSRFISESLPEELYSGLLRTLDACIEERIRRLGEFAGKMPESLKNYQETAGQGASETLLSQKRQLYDNWSRLEQALRTTGQTVESPEKRDAFLKQIRDQIEANGNDNYVAVIRSLDPDAAAAGTDWLMEIIEALTDRWLAVVPAFNSA